MEAVRAEIRALEIQIAEADRGEEAASCAWVTLRQQEQVAAAREKLARLKTLFAELGDE